jgi:hypothetical protein
LPASASTSGTASVPFSSMYKSVFSILVFYYLDVGGREKVTRYLKFKTGNLKLILGKNMHTDKRRFELMFTDKENFRVRDRMAHTNLHKEETGLRRNVLGSGEFIIFCFTYCV